MAALRIALVALALVGVAVAAPASAQVTVVSSETHAATATAGASSDLVVDGDLATATALMTSSADAQLRAAAPQAYAPVDLALVRYRDTTTSIDSVAWRRASDSELAVTIHAHLSATQEHRTLSLAWVADGTVRVADVTLEARVHATFTPSGGLHVLVLGDTISVTPQLAGLSALGQQAVPLEGRQLADRTIDENPLADRHLRGTTLTITGVDGNTAHARVHAVPI